MVMTLTQVDPLQNKKQNNYKTREYLPVACVLHHVDDFILGVLKGFRETLVHQVLVGVVFVEVVVRQVLLHLVFHVEWQSVLEQTTHLPTVLAVAVTNREEVAMLETHDVRRCDVSILVRLVGIVGSYATLCCKRELRHHVADFVWFLRCHRLRLRWWLCFLNCIHIVQIGFHIGLRLDSLVTLPALRIRLFVGCTGWP